MNITAADARIEYFPKFIPMGERFSLFEWLLDNVPWQQDDIVMYGKKMPIPRLQAWFGDTNADYGYSGIRLTTLPWLPELMQLKTEIEHKTQSTFNAALVNLYRDGNDTVGWHSDDESELGHQPTIASISLGETREFQLKHKVSKEKLSIRLTSGSLLVMSGNTQHCWQHCVPRSKRVQSPRINITFRKIIR